MLWGIKDSSTWRPLAAETVGGAVACLGIVGRLKMLGCAAIGLLVTVIGLERAFRQ
jgi:hypothetical protein